MKTALSPVLSRCSVNQTMAARGMRSAADLAAGKPCGTRVRYYAGCRCDACRSANTEYERSRAAARARGERNGLVSADRAREHLAQLSAAGVGRKTAADAAKVAASIISMVIDGQRLKIREQTERRILAVTAEAAADRSYIDGAPTWLLLDELIASGYGRARLASEMAGRKLPSLQLSRERVTVRNAHLARQVYARLSLASPTDQRRVLALLTDLRDEHYRPDKIQAEVNKLAAMRGWGPTSINPRPIGGRWPGPAGLTKRAVGLIEILHARIFDEASA